MMHDFRRNQTCASLVQMCAVMVACVAGAPAMSEPTAMPFAVATPMAPGSVSFIESELAVNRAFVEHAIAESQQTLASLLAQNASFSPPPMLAPQPGTVTGRLADYAATQRAALEDYGDLLRLRHLRISLELDERADDIRDEFLISGFLVPPPNVIPIAQVPAPIITVLDRDSYFPGLTPAFGGFFSSVQYQP